MAFNEKYITFKVDDDDYDNPAFVFFSQRSLFTVSRKMRGYFSTNQKSSILEEIYF